ncbi:hypothetical protein J5N97_016758 [Dioscorea zingiberensis]|uniref:Chorein N-terminal domain-containing protein n=1 Tax=Dioscorea zingiberensis TaxID=325984 RepID=A0A9D5HFY5_9LILI|nr:hypothetical protein J5N97_016758 [Dioscorea zingiberensis]
MESIIAKALEYTLKYWLKSFSRDQFKLQGRTAQLYNLDINGDVLHASIGLPPALNVSTARVGKLEIMLPSVSYVQTEPIVVQIDKLDVVLEENVDSENSRSSCSAQSSTSSSKGSGYGFADKIADGMTIEVGVVNLLIETQGGAGRQGGATWASPLASVTIRNLLLYTTNENWQVVNLKEARTSPIIKMHVWPRQTNEGTKHDDDGAKRLFGGERFLEGISGEAFITVQRTEQNAPLGLEVRLHVTEAVCPSLSEPGLRALLRFFTGLYVCLNRGDVDPKARQRSTEAAGRSIVSIVIDHIFLCIKDADFRLELLMQSLLFFRASVSNGEDVKNLSRIMKSSMDWSAGLWQCIELQEICFEAAMVTADGGPLLNVPPPEGVVRIGVACQQFSSNASVDQLFFVLDIYAYFGRVSEKIRNVGKNKTNRHKIKEPIGEKLMKKIPSDTAVSLAVNKLHLRFLESSSTIGQEMPLVHFAGDELFLKVSHLTLGGAFAVSTTLHWENIHISCVDGEGLSSFVNGTDTLGVQNLLAASNGHPLMRAIF